MSLLKIRHNKIFIGTDFSFGCDLAVDIQHEPFAVPDRIRVFVDADGDGQPGETELKDTCAVTVTEASQTNNDFTLFTDDIVEGDYVIYYSGKAAKATISSNRLGYAEITPAGNKIAASSATADVVWHISKVGDNWVIYNAGASKYMAGNGTKNQAALVADSSNDGATWTITKQSDGTFEIENIKNKTAKVNSFLRNNGTYGFACYASGTGGTLSLYKKA